MYFYKEYIMYNIFNNTLREMYLLHLYVFLAYEISQLLSIRGQIQCGYEILYLSSLTDFKTWLTDLKHFFHNRQHRGNKIKSEYYVSG